MNLNQLLEKIDTKFASPYDSGQTVNVFKNPNRPEMENAKSKSTFNELRGLVYNKTVIYIWDANLATHDDVISVLSLPDGIIWRFILGSDNIVVNADPNCSDSDINDCPMIKRMLK